MDGENKNPASFKNDHIDISQHIPCSLKLDRYEIIFVPK
jgi:hypothetical protein